MSQSGKMRGGNRWVEEANKSESVKIDNSA